MPLISTEEYKGKLTKKNQKSIWNYSWESAWYSIWKSFVSLATEKNKILLAGIFHSYSTHFPLLAWQSFLFVTEFFLSKQISVEDSKRHPKQLFAEKYIMNGKRIKYLAERHQKKKYIVIYIYNYSKYSGYDSPKLRGFVVKLVISLIFMNLVSTYAISWYIRCKREELTLRHRIYLGVWYVSA